MVEFGAAATCLGEDEPALFDEAAQVLAGGLRELGISVAVKKDNGGLKHVLDGREAGVDGLPGQKAVPVPRDDSDHVADVVGVVVPIVGRQVSKLVDQDGRAALGQEEKGETGGDQVVLLGESYPESPQLVLSADQFLGAEPIPVETAEEPDAGEPAGALKGIEVVMLPNRAVSEVLADLKMAAQPVDAVRDSRVQPSLAAIVDHMAFEELLALEPPGAGDDQTRKPGAGHASRRLALSGSIGPAAVAILQLLEVHARHGPDLGIDADSGLARGIEAKQGILGIRIVSGLKLLIGVSPATRPLLAVGELQLGALQPLDVRYDPDEILPGLRGGVDHSLERDAIRALQILRAEVAEILQGPQDRW